MIPMTKRPKILFVAIQTSVHAARWIEQAARLDYECHVFPVSADLPHQKLKNVTLHIPTLNDKPRISSRREMWRGYLVRATEFAQLVLENPREAFRRLKTHLLFGGSAAIVELAGFDA